MLSGVTQIRALPRSQGEYINQIFNFREWELNPQIYSRTIVSLRHDWPLSKK